MKTHLKIHIKGHVQAVAFRYHARLQADKLKLKGIIKNNPDGSVYAEVEGSLKNLESFVKWCHQGPKHAVVDSVEVKKGRLKKYQKFEIIR